jgi:hypothetical protein
MLGFLHLLNNMLADLQSLWPYYHLISVWFGFTEIMSVEKFSVLVRTHIYLVSLYCLHKLLHNSTVIIWKFWWLQTISYAAERVVGTGSFGIVFQVTCFSHCAPAFSLFWCWLGSDTTEFVVNILLDVKVVTHSWNKSLWNPQFPRWQCLTSRFDVMQEL